jgi:hypothetical protein
MRAALSGCLLEDIQMKRWIGRWLMAVGAVHIPFALFKHHAIWAGIAEAGVLDVVAGHPARGHAAWFLVAGPSVLFLGYLIDVLEQLRMRPPLVLGVALLLMAALLLVLMPRSGSWLLLPPAFALIARAVGPGEAQAR